MVGSLVSGIPGRCVGFRYTRASYGDHIRIDVGEVFLGFTIQHPCESVRQ